MKKKKLNLVIKFCLSIGISIFAIKVVFAFAYTNSTISSTSYDNNGGISNNSGSANVTNYQGAYTSTTLNGNNQGVMNNAGTVTINNGTITTNNYATPQDQVCLAKSVEPLTAPITSGGQPISCDAISGDHIKILGSQKIDTYKWYYVQLLTGKCANTQGWYSYENIKNC